MKSQTQYVTKPKFNETQKDNSENEKFREASIIRKKRPITKGKQKEKQTKSRSKSEQGQKEGQRQGKILFSGEDG